jgi:hypothetical protein
MKPSFEALETSQKGSSELRAMAEAKEREVHQGDQRMSYLFQSHMKHPKNCLGRMSRVYPFSRHGILQAATPPTLAP